MKNVIIVEDNEDLGKILKAKFSSAGYEVTMFKNGLDVLSSLRDQPPSHAIILDIMIPGRSGYELLNSVKAIWPETAIFIFSSYEEYRKKIPREMIDGFFLKTDGVDNLISAVGAKIEKQSQ